MADEIFEVIFKMDGDSKALVSMLNDVNSKYVQTSNVINEQQKKLDELIAREKLLLAARAKSTNPSQVVKYNEAIELNKKSITETTAEVNKLATANNNADKSAQKFGKDVAGAMDAAKVIGMKNEVKNLEKQLQDSGKAGEDAGKKTSNAFLDLRAQLKAAKGDLADAFGTGNQDAINEASKKVGEIKDRINDLNDTTNAFASGSQFQKIGNLFRDVAANIVNLDFGRAEEQSAALLKTTKALTLKEGIQGVKQLGSTFANIGKALLVNPIFLIAGVIALIIAKFDALRGAGGLIGAIFNGIAKAIDILITSGKDLLDFLGIIDSTKKSLEELIDEQELLIKQTEQFYDSAIAKRKAFNQATIGLEQQRTKEVQKSLLKEVEDTKASLLEKDASYEDFYESYKKLIDIGIRASQLETSQTVRNIEIQIAAQNKLRDLRKATQDEANKGAEFQIKFGLQPDSEKQIKAAFDLQKKELESARNEELRQAAIDFSDYDGGLRAKVEINKKYLQIQSNLANEQSKAILDAEKKTALDRLNISKDYFDKENAISESNGTLTEIETVEAKEQILIDYYIARKAIIEKAIAAEKKLGLDSSLNQTDLKQQLEAQKEQFEALEKQKRTLNESAFSEEERHQLEMFDINKIYQRKISEILESQDSDRLKKQIDFEKQRLDNLLKYNKEESQVVIAQKNKLDELRTQEQEQQKEDNRQLLLAVADGVQQVTDALFAGINQLYTARLSAVDAAVEKQQKAVDDVKDIAEKGNAALLDEEKKRLDKLNDEKEKYVKRQQALAIIELIANSAIAVSKAAAQGGVAAAFTITATLIALAAGLAEAKALAGQAAYYEGGEFGGEGYTGDGNPRGESMNVGKKPYTYHNKEYIFNHKTTSKYIDIFREVHNGNIDLNSWKSKVEAYESLKNMPMGISVNEQGNEIFLLNSKLEKVISAIEGQQSNVNIDGDGFTVYLKNIQTRNDFIKNKLAK